MKNQREGFVLLARMPEANISELSRRFGISRPTAYKWLQRHDARAADGALGNRSTKPASSPRRSSLQFEDAVLALRAQQAAWGGRKRSLCCCASSSLRWQVNSSLMRHGCISERASAVSKAWQRFEHATPNELWQIDFKGHCALERGRCHALPAIDDHSRYSVVLKALQQETRAAVQAALS